MMETLFLTMVAHPPANLSKAMNASQIRTRSCLIHVLKYVETADSMEQDRLQTIAMMAIYQTMTAAVILAL